VKLGVRQRPEQKAAYSSLPLGTNKLLLVFCPSSKKTRRAAPSSSSPIVFSIQLEDQGQRTVPPRPFAPVLPPWSCGEIRRMPAAGQSALVDSWPTIRPVLSSLQRLGSMWFVRLRWWCIDDWETAAAAHVSRSSGGTRSLAATVRA